NRRPQHSRPRAPFPPAQLLSRMCGDDESPDRTLETMCYSDPPTSLRCALAHLERLGRRSRNRLQNKKRKNMTTAGTIPMPPESLRRLVTPRDSDFDHPSEEPIYSDIPVEVY